MVRIGRRLEAGAALVVLASCYRASPSERHMWEHYSQIGELQTAVFRGKLARAQAAAGELAEHQSMERLPPGSERFVDEMRTHARTVSGANSVDTAASATARLGRTCGACHMTYGVGPLFTLGSEPSEGTDMLSTGMIQHVWAADRLWDGLVGPSDAMWTAGAEALATAPFYEDAAAGRVGSLAAAQQLANRLREIGRQASGLEKSDQRVETYGRVIASCAHCHSITGDG